MSRAHTGHPSAAPPEVPSGSSRQRLVQEALPCAVDKDGQHYADSGPSARGPVALHPHPAQSLEAFPFLLFHLPFQGDCLLSAAGTYARKATGGLTVTV